METTEQPPILKLQSQGASVRLLQFKLALLGLANEIPESEITTNTYGSGTQKALVAFENRRRPRPTGILDDQLLKTLDAAVASIPLPEIQKQLFFEFKRYQNQIDNLDAKTFKPVQESLKALQLEYDLFKKKTEALNTSVPELAQLEQAMKEAAKRIKDFETAGLDKVNIEEFIRGEILDSAGLPLSKKVNLRLYEPDFGGKVKLLSETTTDLNGRYLFNYAIDNKLVGLEIRAIDETGKETPVFSSFDGLNEKNAINIVAPPALQPKNVEYQRLKNDLELKINKMSVLAIAEESFERRDLTFLNKKTNWDARLIALASNAEKLSNDPEFNFPPEGLYGLFRMGLPLDKQGLVSIRVEAIREALKKANEAGIIALTDDQIKAFTTQFKTVAPKVLFNKSVPGSSSTYNDLLKISNLDKDKQEKFSVLYLNHEGTDEELWEKAATILTSAEIGALQLQGKLAYLTGNNVNLVSDLQKSIQDPVQLVNKDLFEAEKWKALITAVANSSNIPLEKFVPPAYGGALEERLSAYAEDMARKLRLSYPNEIVARMINKDSDQFKLGDTRQEVSTFIQNAIPLGFKLGEVPVTTFLQKINPAQLDSNKVFYFEALKPIKDKKPVIDQVKKIQRLYQITPSNEAMKTMLSLGFTSAYDVVSISEEAFVESYGNHFPSEEQARLTYRKSTQVASTVYNLFTVAKNLESRVPVFAYSASPEVRDQVKSNLIKEFPTMESLLGSMDYCECEHCRSILSPAAYLVDLLQFVEGEKAFWDRFQEEWKKKHNDREYGLSDYKFPYKELTDRRPDLPQIQLTCENTQTALPYIDLVNEILEYYVANDALDAKAAHDTDGISSSELLAEPQNIVPKAYSRLLEARYPLTLPFDLWIETVRAFANYFEMPLWKVLEACQRNKKLFAANQEPYGYSAIFAEQLGLSPAEYNIFVRSDLLDIWHELYGYPNKEMAVTEAIDPITKQRIDLNSAKTLSRRLGVSYKELVEIIETNFINPLLEPLIKLGISITDVLFYKNNHQVKNAAQPLSLEDQAKLKDIIAFEQRLNAISQQFQVIGFDALTWLNKKLQENTFNKAIILVESGTGSDFDNVTLRYVDNNNVDVIDFLKINLFVRLWRKLGWTIEEVDYALQIFTKNMPFTVNNVKDKPLKIALVYLAHLKMIDQQVNLGKLSRIKLLTLWSDIPTTGKQSLYAQLFLTKNVLKNDIVFGSPAGDYLLSKDLDEVVKLLDNPPADLKMLLPNIQNMTEVDKENFKKDFKRIKGHLFALQGSLGLSLDDIRAILSDARISASNEAFDTTELSLANVSVLYRYGLLAKALKLSIRDLITLKKVSGIDPFMALSTTPIGSFEIEDDHPFNQTLKFIQVVEKIKETEFKIEDLDYLICHHFDPTKSQYRTNEESRQVLLKSLADGIRAIQSEHAILKELNVIADEALRQKLNTMLPTDTVSRLLSQPIPKDSSTIIEEVLKQKLSLILPSDVVQRFLSMINGTVEFTVKKEDVPDTQLKLTDFVNEPSIRQISYNATRREQKLTFRSVLFGTQKAELKRKYPYPVFGDLLDAVEVEARTFFSTYLEKTANTSLKYGFLEREDFEILFVPQPIMPSNLTDSEQKEYIKAQEEIIKRQRAKIMLAFLPALQQRLIRQFVVQTLTTHFSVDASLLEYLLTDSQLLKNPGSLLENFANIDTGGINVDFSVVGNNIAETVTFYSFLTVDTGWKNKDGSYLKPQNAERKVNGARFDGYFEVPVSAGYRFYIEFDKKEGGAELREAQFTLKHLSNSVLEKSMRSVSNDKSAVDAYVELKAGILYRLTFEVKNLNGSDVRLLVQGETLPKGNLSNLTLYSGATIGKANDSYILLSKALQIILGFNFSVPEVLHIFKNNLNFDRVDLSALPVIENTDRNTIKSFFNKFLRLVVYARLKKGLVGGNADLIPIFGSQTLTQVYPLLAKLTHREESMIKEATELLFPEVLVASAETSNPFMSDLPVARLWQLLQLGERFKVSSRAVDRWTSIVNPGITFEERYAIARDLKETIKSRFEPQTWQTVAQPIFDKLRQMKRNTLTAHIMHVKKFTQPEQLYEYFLIDPLMEPVVQTSRIRLAIASVQLFIQRCLLNLEKSVHPSVINAKQWEWMKRYRIWEANRKIFLFPENWLEPEFRDDKSHLFTELEGKLLEGDVSNDLVEDVFFNYLKKLEELAHLDIVAMHCEDKTHSSSEIFHIIGRTHNEPYKYFYRRYIHQEWTPWEPIPVEIQGDHLAPVIWRNRLYLFWVTFLEKPSKNIAETSYSGDAPAAQMKLSEIINSVSKASLQAKSVEVQLHWSEYLQGRWSTQQCGGITGSVIRQVGVDFNKAPETITYPNASSLTCQLHVGADFNSQLISIHVSKEYDKNTGEERGVYINLANQLKRFCIKEEIKKEVWNGQPRDVKYHTTLPISSIDFSFYLAGRNSTPQQKDYQRVVSPLYSFTKAVTTRYYAPWGILHILFSDKVELEAGKITSTHPAYLKILDRTPPYKLLLCNNPDLLNTNSISESYLRILKDETRISNVVSSTNLNSLRRPFFYQDDAENTFFVMPTVEEKSLPKWNKWLNISPLREAEWISLDKWKELISAHIPSPINPERAPAINPNSTFNIEAKTDWLINPSTVLHIGGELIGPTGRIDAKDPSFVTNDLKVVDNNGLLTMIDNLDKVI